MVKITRPLTHQEIMDSLTEEIAREMGYPSVEAMRLEDELGNLAADYAHTEDEAIVKEYHRIYAQLIEMGWDPNMLTVQDVLPAELMPKLPEDND